MLAASWPQYEGNYYVKTDKEKCDFYITNVSLFLVLFRIILLNIGYVVERCKKS